MDERPFPHGPLPQPPPSRRGVLVVGVLALAAAGGGVWFATSSEHDAAGSAQPTAPAQLRAAAASERALIANADAALKHAHGANRSALQLVRADHVAHLHAIEAAIADALYPLGSASPASGASSGAPSSPPAGTTKVRVADVRAAEKQAARVAAGRAAQLDGRAAVLMASIAASEATHAELLSGGAT